MAIVEFHIPVRPYSPIDAHNRRAAALGSPRYAQLTEVANYNGHHVTVSFNSHSGYWIAEYTWAGRVVLARGTLVECLAAAKAEHARGALGASVSAYYDGPDGKGRSPSETEEEFTRACSELGFVAGSIWKETSGGMRNIQHGSWWTWRHDVGNESARDAANPGRLVLIFDWPLCEAAESREAYEKALRAKYGHVYQ